MNGPLAGALLLAFALIAVRPSPRRRLSASRQRRLPTVGPGAAGGVAVGFGCISVIVLPLTTVLCVAVVVATARVRYRRRRLIRRATAEGHALQSALEVLVGELRAGAHPVRAFCVAANDTAGAAGLAAAAGCSALPMYWERLALCWRLASDNGLGIATLMRAAQRDIAERQRFSARVASSMAGARATAAILAALPVLGVLLGQLIGARPLGFLLSGHAGGWLLLVGSALACAGLLWSDRIADRVTS
jgi:tight adherence protein B